MANETKQNLNPDPMPIIIGSPLAAACKAQDRLAEASSAYKKNIRLYDSENLLAVEDEVEQAIKTIREYESGKTPENVPLLGLLKLHEILMDDKAVDFQMEVSSTVSENKPS
ncbi:DUF2589 domain-containing protein [Treponema sp.]|uniref:DUF2589 domain-containing protein n=1 Tax=Treponema sp. TaxID=166 RepID=UPI003F077341